MDQEDEFEELTIGAYIPLDSTVAPMTVTILRRIAERVKIEVVKWTRNRWSGSNTSENRLTKTGIIFFSTSDLSPDEKELSKSDSNMSSGEDSDKEVPPPLPLPEPALQPPPVPQPLQSSRHQDKPPPSTPPSIYAIQCTRDNRLETMARMELRSSTLNVLHYDRDRRIVYVKSEYLGRHRVIAYSEVDKVFNGVILKDLGVPGGETKRKVGNITVTNRPNYNLEGVGCYEGMIIGRTHNYFRELNLQTGLVSEYFVKAHSFVDPVIYDNFILILEETKSKKLSIYNLDDQSLITSRKVDFLKPYERIVSMHKFSNTFLLHLELSPNAPKGLGADSAYLFVNSRLTSSSEKLYLITNNSKPFDLSYTLRSQRGGLNRRKRDVFAVITKPSKSSKYSKLALCMLNCSGQENLTKSRIIYYQMDLPKFNGMQVATGDSIRTLNSADPASTTPARVAVDVFIKGNDWRKHITHFMRIFLT